MTNFEKYKEMIRQESGVFSIDEKGNVCSCMAADCEKCIFNHGFGCNAEFFEWLYEEYKEPKVDWSAVKKDTEIIINGLWNKKLKRYFSEYKEEKVFYYGSGATSWSATNVYWAYENEVKLAEEKY